MEGRDNSSGITWKITTSYIQGDSPTPDDFTALHGDRVIGRIHQIPHGPARGCWSWALTLEEPNEPGGDPPSGRAAARAEAGRRLILAYEAFLQRPRSRVR